MSEKIIFDRQTLDNVTIEDCMDMYLKKGFYALIEDGLLIAFVKETEDNRFWRR